MASMGTGSYNVYSVYLKQAGGPLHVGIALVPAQQELQERGRFYHVKGIVGLGMDYERRPSFHFTGDRFFEKKVLQSQMPKSRLVEFEHIASTRPPPHGLCALTEREPGPPVRNCATWVAEVLEEAHALLQNRDSAA